MKLHRSRILSGLALCLLVASAGYAEEVVFQNKTEKVLFVLGITGEGGCWLKYPAVRHVFPLSPGESEKVSVIGSENSVCWVASPHEKISNFVLHCGDAKAPSTVVFLESTPLCALEQVSTNFKVLEAESDVAGKKVGAELIRKIGVWDDPLTPPQTRRRCVKWAKGHWPWCDRWKECVGHAYECRKLRNEMFLRVTADLSPDDLRGKVNDCLNKSAVAAAIAGVIGAYTTGQGIPAAEAAFKTVFAACMADASGLSIELEVRNKWTSWGRC